MPKNAELAQDISAPKKEIEELRGSLTLFNSLYETMKEKQEELDKENKDLSSNNQQLAKRIAELEQYSRLSNVEIEGVPSIQGEDCAAVLQCIGDKVVCPIASTDIEIVHIVPAKKETNIIAKVYSREKKADFVGKAEKARLTTESIGFSAPED